MYQFLENTMKKEYGIIFDMDGTLYSFANESGGNFAKTQFYEDVITGTINFLSERLAIKPEQAQAKLQQIRETYNEGISLGIEKEFGIDRYDYFAGAWGTLEPANYIQQNLTLENQLIQANGRIALLTAAPKVWASKVLSFFNLRNVFGDLVTTGEPDLRKPDPAVFLLVAQQLNLPPQQIYSVGDQEHSDIIPAKEVGMKTLRIGRQETVADYSASDISEAIKLLTKLGAL